MTVYFNWKKWLGIRQQINKSEQFKNKVKSIKCKKWAWKMLQLFLVLKCIRQMFSKISKYFKYITVQLCIITESCKHTDLNCCWFVFVYEDLSRFSYSSFSLAEIQLFNFHIRIIGKMLNIKKLNIKDSFQPHIW